MKATESLLPVEGNPARGFPHGRGRTLGALLCSSVAFVDEILSVGTDFPSFSFYGFFCSPLWGILVAITAVWYDIPYPLLIATACFMFWLVLLRIFEVIPDDWNEFRQHCPDDTSGTDFVANDVLILSRVFGVKDVCTGDKAFLVIDAIVLAALVPAVFFFWLMGQAAVEEQEASHYKLHPDNDEREPLPPTEQAIVCESKSNDSSAVEEGRPKDTGSQLV